MELGQLAATRAQRMTPLTSDWGEWKDVSLYLERCQVDTPADLVAATWRHVRDLRPSLGSVVDFGAGDGRFAHGGKYDRYIGYEIDRDRCIGAVLPPKADFVHRCAFSDDAVDADLCIGNPPFVRNQDLPEGWRSKVSEVLFRRTGIEISGLANAWQYFLLLSLISTKADGLCALIIPYEWVSRPSVKKVREYIIKQGWNVNVYRLVDTKFSSVLTTSSITIIDKSTTDGVWRYYEETAQGDYVPLASPSGHARGVLPYMRRSEVTKGGPRAVRGLSPGTQKVLTLTEGERVRLGLQIDRDVVRCVTSLKNMAAGGRVLDEATFRSCFRDAGQKCWLIRTEPEPSPRLMAYLDSVPEENRNTSTCKERDDWWRFRMPDAPDVLISLSFKGSFPKAARNGIGARAVGAVCGIYNVDAEQAERVIDGLGGVEIRDRVVAHANGLRKIEINQLNSLLTDLL